ncbi:hypothetical protein EV174_006327, partial [Coemansia sp. RSA 2320]
MDPAAPDIDSLQRLDTPSSSSDEWNCVDMIVQVWARGHCLAGDSFDSREIVFMSEITRQSSADLIESLRSSLDLNLRPCQDAESTRNTRRWRI